MTGWSNELMRWALTVAGLLVVTGCIVCWVIWTEKRMSNVIVGRWPGSSDEPPRAQPNRDRVAEIVRSETGCAPERADFIAHRVLELINAAERA